MGPGTGHPTLIRTSPIRSKERSLPYFHLIFPFLYIQGSPWPSVMALHRQLRLKGGKREVFFLVGEGYLSIQVLELHADNIGTLVFSDIGER